MIKSSTGRPPRLLQTFRKAVSLRRFIVASTTLLALGACDVPSDQPAKPDSSFLKEVPEQVVALAAPHQDLKAVRLRAEDGCYWYRHVGPVETTMLPLRTPSGSPICTKRADTVPVTG